MYMFIYTNRVIDNAIQHAFKSPGKFAQQLSTNKATTSFQGMVGTSYGCQRLFIRRVVFPARQKFLDTVYFLSSLLKEDLQDLIIHLADNWFEILEFVTGKFIFSCLWFIFDNRNGFLGLTKIRHGDLNRFRGLFFN